MKTAQCSVTRRPGVLFCLLVLQAAVILQDRTCLPAAIGESFPSFSQANTLSRRECDYLNIPAIGEISLQAIPHAVVVLEFLNVYCETCREEVGLYNELFQRTITDPALTHKVCVLGVAVGNSLAEVERFRQTYGVQYPIMTDPDKVIFNLTGNVRGAPHVDVLARKGRDHILQYHAWGETSLQTVLAAVTSALGGKISGTGAGNLAPAYAFESGGAEYTEKDFAGKKVILYFPVSRTYALKMDSRNSANQLRTLERIRTMYPDMAIIFFQPRGVQVQVPSTLIDARARPGVLQSLGSQEHPTVYYINEQGLIVFKAQALTLPSLRAVLEGGAYVLRPALGEDEIVRLIEKRIAALGHKALVTEKVMLNTTEFMYVTTLFPKRDNVFWFSRLESSPSLCDVCHDSHFIYIFDQEGVVRDFVALELYKAGNARWSAGDVAKTSGMFVGRNIFDDFSFAPEADAVSTATMTSSLVFDAFNRGKHLLGDFKDYHFRYRHWEQVCFRNYCRIKRKIDQLRQQDAQFVLNDQTLRAVIDKYHFPTCPLNGIYVVFEGEIICSVFGMHRHDCRNGNE